MLLENELNIKTGRDPNYPRGGHTLERYTRRSQRSSVRVRVILESPKSSYNRPDGSGPRCGRGRVAAGGSGRRRHAVTAVVAMGPSKKYGRRTKPRPDGALADLPDCCLTGRASSVLIAPGA